MRRYVTKTEENKIRTIDRMVKRGYLVDELGRLVHREVCRKVNGEYPRSWVVHHIDHDKLNNKPDNLIAMPRNLHESIHRAMRKKRCMFNLEQLTYMVEAVRKLAYKKPPRVIINVTISPTQLDPQYPKISMEVLNTEVFYNPYLDLKKSGSARYR